MKLNIVLINAEISNMKNNFDSYIAIDWSGAETIYTKSIAVAKIDHDCNVVKLVDPIKSKLWSRTDIYEWLQSLTKDRKRYFVGIDANFSFAQSIIVNQLPHINNAYELWENIDNICKDNNNFYAKNFWTHSDWQKLFWIHGTLPEHFPTQSRLTEQACANNKMGRPENPFKIIGAKQVGKGGLSVMRMLHRLHKNLGVNIAIWPFDSDERINSAKIVFAEIYPRIFIQKSEQGNKKIRINDDLNTVLSFFNSNSSQIDNISDHQTDALISAVGIKQLIQNYHLLQDMNKTNESIQFEGWIFGV